MERKQRCKKCGNKKKNYSGIESKTTRKKMQPYDASESCMLANATTYELFGGKPKTKEEKIKLLEYFIGKLTQIIDGIPLPLILHDKEFKIVQANAAYLKLTSKKCGSILKKYYGEIFPSDDGNPPKCVCKLPREIEYNKKWYKIYSFPMENPLKGCYQLSMHLFQDITQQHIFKEKFIKKNIHSKTLSKKLNKLSNYDHLTELPNKSFFVQLLKNAIAEVKNDKRKLAVLMLNIDEFKKINDAFGMPTGDAVLKITAERVLNILRPNTNVSRIGGDNFLILLPKINKDSDALNVAKRILSVFNFPFKLKSKELYLKATIGISIPKKISPKPENLIKQADLAMEKAKIEKTTHIAFFEPSFDKLINQRLNVKSDLYKALEREEFLLRYQPQISIKSGRIIGAEALLCWKHPKKGLLLPGSFIDVALDSDLILPIGDWVLKEACRQLVEWKEAGVNIVPVAVNISAIQLRQENFVKTVKNIIRNSGIDAKNLGLELTEQIMLSNTNENIKLLKKFSNMGIELSLDDFGTGYSSLSYLRKLPITKLKIDMSFVRHLADSEDAVVITKTIILLAKGLGIKSIAEGVETKKQFEILRDLQCDQIQGFYFSKPVTANDFKKMLAKRIKK